LAKKKMGTPEGKVAGRNHGICKPTGILKGGMAGTQREGALQRAKTAICFGQKKE